MRAKVDAVHAPELKAEALALAEEVGIRQAARRLQIHPSTVYKWVKTTGTHTPTRPPVPAGETRSIPQDRVHRITATVATMAERKAALAQGLLEDAERLRAQLFAPVTERVVNTVSDGHLQGQHVEITDVRLSRPKPADQRQIMTALAIAVDKAQILTGEATERVEQLHGSIDPAARRTRALAVVHELADRVAS